MSANMRNRIKAQYFVRFVSPGSAETNNKCGGKLDKSFDCQLC